MQCQCLEFEKTFLLRELAKIMSEYCLPRNVDKDILYFYIKTQ